MISALLKTCWVLLRVLGCYFLALCRWLVPVKPKDIRGKLVLVTGGRRGIGRALGMEFAKQGANIVLWDIDKAETDQAADDIRKATGVKALSYVCDVTDYDKVKATASQVRRDIGEVDILVNSAGVVRFAAVVDEKPEEISRLVNVNVLAHFWTLKEFLPYMVSKKEGHILAVSSVAGYIGCRNGTPYVTSKYAVRGMCDSLEQELRINHGHSGVHVSVLFPAMVCTQLLRDMAEQGNLHLDESEMVTPEYTAELAVAGVLKNQRHIFVPPMMSGIQYLNTLLPKQAYDIFVDMLTPEEKKNK